MQQGNATRAKKNFKKLNLSREKLNYISYNSYIYK